MSVAEACHAYGLRLLPYGVLAGGFLTGKYLHGAHPEGARHLRSPNYQSRYSTPAMHVAAEKYEALAARKGLSLTQLAIAWCALAVQELHAARCCGRGSHVCSSGQAGWLWPMVAHL